MKEEEFKRLHPGDIIRHKDGSEGFIVHGQYLTGGVLVVRSQLARNPIEWDLVAKANHEDVQVTEGEEDRDGSGDAVPALP